MLNQVILAGRIVNISEKEENTRSMNMSIEIPRSFKNMNGEYDTDIITCRMYKNISKATSEYCHIGDTVGVRGRIETINNEMIIVAEKVMFLSNSKNN